MSDQVISLSSDEEGNNEPPPKKRKVTPDLPECTVTLISNKPIESASKTIETVSLDSDDEISIDNNDSTKKSVSNVNSTHDDDKVDLISLIDDEEDNLESKRKKINGTNNFVVNSKPAEEVSAETVTVSIDDSDTEVTEVETSKEIERSVDKGDAYIEKTEKDKEKYVNSIIIDDSDDETEKENHCENESINAFPVHIEKTSANDIASTSKLATKSSKKHLDEYKTNDSNTHKEASRIIKLKNDLRTQDELEEAKGLFKKFIRVIEEKIVDSSFEEILPRKAPIIKKYFNRSGAYINDKVFQTLLTESIAEIKKSSTANAANCAVLAFRKVFEHLKLHVTETTIVVEEDNLPKIKKLEHTIKLLRKRIQQLEVAEVDFDDDEDSAYIMLDRYQARLNKVYAKYCQYINRNPYNGRATYDRITFVHSSYNEINQALTKKYKNSLVFPSYHELETYITKASKKEKLNLSENEIRTESQKCFKALGSILQKKRRQELYDSHLDFVESSEDPATKDVSLENVLKKNYVEGKEKIEKLYQKYVNKQEKGEDQVSTDQEQSSEDSEDEDIKDKKGKAKKNGKLTSKTKDVKKEDSKNKKENRDKHNNNQNDIKEDQEKTKGKENLNNVSTEEKSKSANNVVNLEDKPKNKKAKENQRNRQGNEKECTKNAENKIDIEKDSIETQEEFLAALNIQKQKPVNQTEDI